MGLQIRDERQLKALTGLSQAQVDHLLPVFSEVYMEKQQQKYAAGVAAGARTRKPGGGAKGKLLTMIDKLLFVLYYYLDSCDLPRQGQHATLGPRRIL